MAQGVQEAMTEKNRLFFGDNLAILREYIKEFS
jgi:hypothetical protein